MPLLCYISVCDRQARKRCIFCFDRRIRYLLVLYFYSFLGLYKYVSKNDVPKQIWCFHKEQIHCGFFHTENLRHVTVAAKWMTHYRKKCTWKLTCGSDIRSAAYRFMSQIYCGFSPLTSVGKSKSARSPQCCGFFCENI